jgi:hypothetical protein
MKYTKYAGGCLLLAALAALVARGAEVRAPVEPARHANEGHDAPPPHGFTDRSEAPRTSPATRAAPTEAAARDLRERLAVASYEVGEDAADRYARFLDALRADQTRSTALLLESLRQMPHDERQGAEARPVVYALGAVGDASALGELAGLLDEPLPASAPLDHHHDPRAEALVTRSMALDAMVAIAERAADPRTLGAVDDRLRALVAAPDTSAHLVATAVGALRRHAEDPAAEVERLEASLGAGRAWLAHLEYRSIAPATGEAR